MRVSCNRVTMLDMSFALKTAVGLVAPFNTRYVNRHSANAHSINKHSISDAASNYFSKSIITFVFISKKLM